MSEVLDHPAAEAAEILDVSVGAFKSLLQRARVRIATAASIESDFAEPSDPGAQRVLERYSDAFERSDAGAIERLLADDAVLEVTGTTTWFSGKATCAPYIAAQAIGRQGDWRSVEVRANGQLAAAVYRRDADGIYQAFAIAVLATTSSALRRINLFGDAGLFDLFDLPDRLNC